MSTATCRATSARGDNTLPPSGRPTLLSTAAAAALSSIEPNNKSAAVGGLFLEHPLLFAEQRVVHQRASAWLGTLRAMLSELRAPDPTPVFVGVRLWCDYIYICRYIYIYIYIYICLYASAWLGTLRAMLSELRAPDPTPVFVSVRLWCDYRYM